MPIWIYGIWDMATFQIIKIYSYVLMINKSRDVIDGHTHFSHTLSIRRIVAILGTVTALLSVFERQTQ